MQFDAFTATAGPPPGDRQASAGLPPGYRQALVSCTERSFSVLDIEFLLWNTTFLPPATAGLPPGNRRATAKPPPSYRQATAGLLFPLLNTLFLY